MFFEIMEKISYTIELYEKVGIRPGGYSDGKYSSGSISRSLKKSTQSIFLCCAGKLRIYFSPESDRYKFKLFDFSVQELQLIMHPSKIYRA